MHVLSIEDPLRHWKGSLPIGVLFWIFPKQDRPLRFGNAPVRFEDGKPIDLQHTIRYFLAHAGRSVDEM